MSISSKLNMIKKSLSAFVGIAVIASSLVATSGAANAVTPRTGAITNTTYSVDQQFATTYPATNSASVVLPEAAQGFSSYTRFELGSDAAKLRAGHEIRITWNQSFPTGTSWFTSGSSITNRVIKYVAGYGQGGYQPLYSEFNPRSESSDSSDPQYASLIKIPDSAATGISGSQTIEIALGVSGEKSYGNTFNAGTYTISPVLYDKTAGQLIPISTSVANGNVWVGDRNSSYNANGTFTGQVGPYSNVRQSMVTCVSKSDLVTGHVIELKALRDGVALINSGSTAFWYKGTNTLAGNFNTVGNGGSTYTVTATDTGSTGTGFRINTGITFANQTANSVPISDQQYVVTDNTAGGAQIESSCAPETPAAPTFDLRNRNSAQITWTKVPTDVPTSYNGRTVTYNYAIYKASAPTVAVVTGSFMNPTLSGDTYTSSYTYFQDSNMAPINLDADTDYFAKIIAKPNYDVVPSNYSAASAVDSLVSPATPAAPTFTMTSLTAGTLSWTRIPTDQLVNGNRTVMYQYEIYKASDLTTPVSAGGFPNPTLTGDAYSATLTSFRDPNQMNYGMTVTLLANTNYVAKIKAMDTSLSIESAFSAASATTSISGPAAPSAPTITALNYSQITGTLVVPANSQASYSAKAYDEAHPTVEVGSGSCMAITPGATTLTCTVRATGVGGFSAPNFYVLKAFARLNMMDSLPSAASNHMLGGFPGVSILTAPTGGLLNGDARVITSTFPAITDIFGGGVSSKGSFLMDGRGGVYTVTNAGENSAHTGVNFDVRKIKSDVTGFDSTFGTAGKSTTTITYGSGNTTVTMPSMALFGHGTKLALVSTVSNCPPVVLGQPYNCVTPGTTTLREATLGSAFSTPVDMGTKAIDFCNASGNAIGDIGTTTAAGFGLTAGFQELDRPVATVSCTGDTDTTVTPSVTKREAFYVTVDADGTLHKLFAQYTYSSTQNSLLSSAFSVNTSATAATDVATVGLLVRVKNVSNVYTNYQRVIVRVKMDGTVIETPDAFPVTGSSQPSVSLAAVNDGSTVYGFYGLNGPLKLMTTSVTGSATFTVAANPIAIDNAGQMVSSTLRFPTTGAPVVNGKIAFIRTDASMSGSSMGPMSYDITSGTSVSGEMISYALAGSPVNYSFIDANGHMDFIFTKDIDQTTNLVHSVIQWKNVRGMVAVPTPAVSEPVSTFSLNAGGTSVTINGVNLAETSAAKKVVNVTVGTKVITAITKTATSIVFKLPTATDAGAASGVIVPTATAPVQVPIVLTYGTNTTIPAGTVAYVGATKVAQPVTLTADTAGALTTDSDRSVSAVSAAVTAMLPGSPPRTLTLAAIGVPNIITSTPAICTIVDGKVHFVSNGNCIVSAVKAGNDWMADGSDTKTIAVLKGDVVTVSFADGDSASEGASEDDAVTPLVTLASGRTDYTMTSSDPAKCSVNSDTKAVWFKTAGQHCVITIATTGTVNGWAAKTYTWDIVMAPAVGDTAAGAILVRNDNKLVNLPGLGVTWDQKNSKVFFSTRVRRVGPVQVRMTFTALPVGNAPGVEYTCVSNFGIKTKTVLPAVGPLTITSGALCTDTVSRDAAAGAKTVMPKDEKDRQTLAYTKFKELIAQIANPTSGVSYIPVKFEYRRELHKAGDYSPVLNADGSTPPAGYGAWSTFRYAKLNNRATDSITASLPTGVVAAVSATEAGAVVPVITLESKRTDYTVTPTDTAKCDVLADGRIWFKSAGDNCVLTIWTGANTVWAGKSYTWTIPMVAAVAADSATALIAPSNGTAVSAGPLTIVWNQAANSVVVKLSSRNAGLVRVRAQFTDGNGTAHTCIVSFGAKKIAGATDLLKTQTSAALCAGADLVAFKALVTARKSGVGMGVIPITLSYQFDQYNPATGVEIQGQTPNSDTKPWSAGFFVKLNYRATNN